MVLSKFVPVMAAAYGDFNTSSLYLFDPLKDGWLFRLNTGTSTSSGRRVQDMHKIYKVSR